MEQEGFRTASVRVRPSDPEDGAPDGTGVPFPAGGGGGPSGGTDAGCRLGAALLAASPRVAVAGPEICRVDARGWGRRGGEEALARALRRAASEAGFAGVRVGVADAAVASDAAAALAVSAPVVVPPGKDRSFLSPLPLAFLPIPGQMRETFRALGLRRIGEVAALERRELEARLGPEGVRAHRLARGEDDRTFRALSFPELPEARLELDGPVAALEPLLFVLRHLVARVCEELAGEGRCAARLVLELETDPLPGATPGAAPGATPGATSGAAPGVAPSASSRDRPGGRRGPDTPLRIAVSPVRPTARQEPLFGLCRAALERELATPPGGRRSEAGRDPGARRDGGVGRLAGPVSALALRVGGTAPAEARQGDLFARGWRDPLAAGATLSRLRARVGEGGVVRPAPRPDHRPEARSRWTPVGPSDEVEEGGGTTGDHPAGNPLGATAGKVEAATGEAGETAGEAARSAEGEPSPLPPTLRLLPRPVPLQVRTEEGRPASLRDGEGRRRVSVAEGPERLSGDWWREAPYGREYWRLATADGELLWVFRERRGERVRWWLHGWWD